MQVLTERISKGWKISEMKEADAAGRRRKRIKNTGYLIPFFHNDVDGEGTNVIEYRMENKALTVICGLGYFGTNSKWIRGAAPPHGPEGQVFDLTTLQHVDLTAADAPVLTRGRIDAHFIA